MTEITWPPTQTAVECRAGRYDVFTPCGCRDLMCRCLDRWTNSAVGSSLACWQEVVLNHRGLGHCPDAPVAHTMLVLQLTQLREVARAEAVLEDWLRERAGRPDEDPAGLILWANIRLAQGWYAEALDLAGRGVARAAQVRPEFLLPVGHLVLTVASLRLCDLRTAVRYARQLGEDALFGRFRFLGADAAWFAAEAFALERGTEAMADLMDEVVRETLRSGELLLSQPAAAPSLVRSALAADDRKSAALLVRAADLVAAKNPAFRTFQVSALHAAGLFHHRSADLVRAAAEHVDPWARARAAEDAGDLLVADEAGQAEGVALLETASRSYESFSSSHDVARVKARLRAVHGKNHHPALLGMSTVARHGLTVTETRIADLVSQGLTNIQIANQIFLSRHTVAYHLKSIFSKLGISSRGELANLWARQAAAS